MLVQFRCIVEIDCRLAHVCAGLFRPVLAALLLMLPVGASAEKSMVRVSVEEERAWIDYTLPLPHKISIPAKRTVHPREMRVELRTNATALEEHSAKILREFIAGHTGVAADGYAMKIMLGVVDDAGMVGAVRLDKFERLREFPNTDQAYIIEPCGDDTLLVAALDPKGVYYGVQTLRQLLLRGIGADEIVVPLAWVEDWPALANRGFWNCPYQVYKEISMVKLNYLKNFASSSTLAIQPPPESDGALPPVKIYSGHRLDAARQQYIEGRRHALLNVPNMMHVNFWSLDRNADIWNDILRWYPDLPGQGATAFQHGLAGKDARGVFHTPCPSHPMFQRIITDTLKLYAATGIMDVSVWTTEYYSYCSCARCMPPGGAPRQFVLETRAIAAAWREVAAVYPDFRVRVFGFPLGLREDKRSEVADELRQTGAAAWEREMPVIMDELPEDSILEIVYAWNRTGDDVFAATRRHKMVDFGVGATYNNFSAIPGRRDKLIHIHDNHWYGAVAWFVFAGQNEPGFVMPFAANMVCATAEWSWNPHGRSVAEFLRAWATISGIRPLAEAEAWLRLAVRRDSMLGWDRLTADVKFIRNIAQKMKAGEALSIPLAPAHNRPDIEADMQAMLALARQLNDPYIKLRTAHLNNLYCNLFALEDLAELYKAKANPLAVQSALESLLHAVDERERSYRNLMQMYHARSRDKKTMPYGYTRAAAHMADPDYAHQRRIILEELIPLWKSLQ